MNINERRQLQEHSSRDPQDKPLTTALVEYHTDQSSEFYF